MSQSSAQDEITFSSEEIKAHKNQVILQILANPNNHFNPNYQLFRTIQTICGSDSDTIPKVPDAGRIFTDENGSYQIMHNGIKVVTNCYYDAEWLTDIISGLKGHHESQEEKCFYEILKEIPENGVFLELGSYWAYYSLWFDSKIKGAKTYQIEPDLKRLEVGKKNFALNQRSGNFHWAFVGRMAEPTGDMNGVGYISVDDFMDRENIQHLNILHSDIQGAEYDMLQSAVRHLDKIDYIFVSTHDDTHIHPKCLQFLRDHNFIILAEHNMSESFSYDGLIVAKRPGVGKIDSIPIQKYIRSSDNMNDLLKLLA